MSSYLFTSESVSEGHPDKVADQISDAVLDAILVQDRRARVACETMVKTGVAIVAGEVAYGEVEDLVAVDIAEREHSLAEVIAREVPVLLLRSSCRCRRNQEAGADLRAREHECGKHGYLLRQWNRSGKLGFLGRRGFYARFLNSVK